MCALDTFCNRIESEDGMMKTSRLFEDEEEEEPPEEDIILKKIKP